MLKKYAQTLSTFKVMSSEFDVCSTLSETPFVCAVKSIHNLTDLCVTTCMFHYLQKRTWAVPGISKISGWF